MEQYSSYATLLEELSQTYSAVTLSNNLDDFVIVLRSHITILNDIIEKDIFKYEEALIFIFKTFYHLSKIQDGLFRASILELSVVFKILWKINEHQNFVFGQNLYVSLFNLLKVLARKFPESHSQFLDGRMLEKFLINDDYPKLQLESWKIFKYIFKTTVNKAEVVQWPLIEYVVEVISQPFSLDVKIFVCELLLSVLDSVPDSNSDLRRQWRRRLRDQGLLTLLLGQINTVVAIHTYAADRCTLTSRYIWLTIQLLHSSDDQQLFRTIGGLKIILNLLQVPEYKDGIDANESVITTYLEKYYEIIDAASTLVTSLARDEINNLQIAKNVGVYLLAKLLVTLPNIETKSLLQKKLFRSLRFLCSLEQNRKRFSSVFPLSLYETFLNTGHFCQNLDCYDKVSTVFDKLTEAEKLELVHNVERLNQKDKVKCVRDYELMELLGSGAFGSVYKAKMRLAAPTTAYFAVKEVNLSDFLLGSTTEERYTNIRQIVSELDIIKNKLRHPNVIRYHKVFYEEQQLYVVMAYLDGLSLGEQLASMKEKTELYQLARVWRVVLQLLSGLRYLHKAKAIIHRDLTPNNIMVGDRDSITITDFGLARQRLLESIGGNHGGGSILSTGSTTTNQARETKFIFGTLNFVSPEVLQHQLYGEKVDVWALGCIVYQMCSLTPAFSAESELNLAEKISHGRYIPLPEVLRHDSRLRDQPPDFYPIKVDCFVRHCLCVDPAQRLDSVGLCDLLGEEMLTYVDEVQRRCGDLEARVARERLMRRGNRSHDVVTPTGRASLLVQSRSSGHQQSQQPAITGSQENSEGSPKRKTKLVENQKSIGSASSNCVYSPTDRDNICVSPLSFSSIDNQSAQSSQTESSLHTSASSATPVTAAGGTSVLSLPLSSMSRLVQDDDPFVRMLAWLHRLHFLGHCPHQPPSPDIAQPRRRLFRRLETALFSLTPAAMKRHLLDLMAGRPQALPALWTAVAAVSLCPPPPVSESTGEMDAAEPVVMTTEELLHLMEDQLSNLGFYEQSFAS